MKVLVTGGAGYIGSTICSALLDKGHVPIIIDSLITGKEIFTKGRIFYKGDISDRNLLETIFKEHPDIRHAIHCAALIIVPESVDKPFEYYRENVAKSLSLFQILCNLGCKNLVFSSSASMYAHVPGFMVTEESPLAPSSPYARTKYMMEMILKDFCSAYGMKGIALRYFNPIGADPSMRSGIHVRFPSHALGKLVDVAFGKEPTFQITGVNWPTRDGSGIRDYIHIWDLACAHVLAIEKFETIFVNTDNVESNYIVINLGTGKGVTVKELISAFERVYKKHIPIAETAPRLGDVAGAYANAVKAKALLGWDAKLTIDQGILDALKWGEMRSQILGFR